MIRAGLVATIVLAACVTQPKIDLQQTQLMPEEVALRIVAKYASPAWAARPHLWKSGNCPEPLLTRVQYSDITSMQYESVSRRFWVFKDGKAAVFGCPPDVSMYAWISVETQIQAQELANAMASLGAKSK